MENIDWEYELNRPARLVNNSQKRKRQLALKQKDFGNLGKESFSNLGMKRRCACGCGQSINYFNTRGGEKLFSNGHEKRTHYLPKFGAIGYSTESFISRNFGVAAGKFSKEFVFLVMLYLVIKKLIKGERSTMNTKVLINEIKSKALQEIAESLNEVLNRVKTEEIDMRQGMVEIAGHKHLIQTIALDWTFNGAKKRVMEISSGK